MEKPEIIWDRRYQAQRIENWITEAAYCYRFPIYTVTRLQIEYCELIKAIYNYMKKRFRSNYGKYYDRVLTITFHYTEAPYRMTAAFMRDEKIIWSTDPAEQEEAKKYLDRQAVEQFYNELRDECYSTVAQRTEARKIIENVGKITVTQPNIRLIQYKNSVKIKENYLQSNKKVFDGSTYITKDWDNHDYWSMFSALYEKMGGTTHSTPRRDYDDDWSDYYGFDDDDYSDWRYGQRIANGYIKNKLDLTVDYINYPYRMTLHHRWKRLESIVFWSQDETEQNAVKKEFSCWKIIETFYNAYFERRNLYIEKNIVLVANFFATEERKEKTREQRKNNDPTNPEARKRRARRHLQRLGYNLRVSRQRYTKEKYQIVKLDGGEVVMGTNSLDDIERFYMDKDLEDENDFSTGFLYNKEPHLEKREAAAVKALKKIGYKLARHDSFKNIYRRKNYYIWKNKKLIYVNRECYFTLDEIEQILRDNCLEK